MGAPCKVQGSARGHARRALGADEPRRLSGARPAPPRRRPPPLADHLGHVSAPGGEKGPAARRRPRTGREAYIWYVERPVEGGNEADGPLSAPGRARPRHRLRALRHRYRQSLPGGGEGPGRAPRRRTPSSARSILPVQHEEARAALEPALAAPGLRAVVLLGLAGGRMRVALERAALNVMDYSEPDNRGDVVRGAPCVPGGPAAYWSTLPLPAILEALAARGHSRLRVQHGGDLPLQLHALRGPARARRGAPGAFPPASSTSRTCRRWSPRTRPTSPAWTCP